MSNSKLMFSLKISSTGILFCLATTLLLFKPSATNAQAIEQSDVGERLNLESLNVKSDAQKLAQFEREEVEVDVVEPVGTEN